jgi:hypothetical protein
MTGTEQFERQHTVGQVAVLGWPTALRCNLFQEILSYILFRAGQWFDEGDVGVWL